MPGLNNISAVFLAKSDSDELYRKLHVTTLICKETYIMFGLECFKTLSKGYSES